MAKLYWRVKLNGKWTWRPAAIEHANVHYVRVCNYKEEEE